MKNISITTTQNVAIDFPLATLGDRILAELLDGLIKVAFAFVVGILFYAFLNDAPGTEKIWIIFVVIIGIPFVFYHLLFELFMNGQTPGKRAMKCCVASADGNPVTFGKYMIRWLFRIIDVMFYGVVAMLTIGLSDKRQRVGDMLAHTVVIKTNTVMNTDTPLIIPPVEDYEIRYPEISSLTPKNILLIKEVLNNTTKTGNTLLALEMSNKIEQLVNIKRKEDPVVFLQIILADYKHLS